MCVGVRQSRVQSVRGESGSAGLALVGGGVGFSGFTSVGKVGGSVLCRSHLPRLPDPRSRGNYLPVRWRWRGVAEEVRVEMGGEGGSEVTLLPVIFPLSYP